MKKLANISVTARKVSISYWSPQTLFLLIVTRCLQYSAFPHDLHISDTKRKKKTNFVIPSPATAANMANKKKKKSFCFMISNNEVQQRWVNNHFDHRQNVKSLSMFSDQITSSSAMRSGGRMCAGRVKFSFISSSVCLTAAYTICSRCSQGH